MTSQLIDLSHRIEPGMFTHPGLPGPTSTPFRSREESRQTSGTDFQIDQVTMVGNTGTYLDSPFHRFADGGDLASLPLTAVADLPLFVVDARQGGRGVGPEVLAAALDDAVAGEARRSRGPAAHRRRSGVGRRGVRRGRAVPHWRRRRMARRATAGACRHRRGQHRRPRRPDPTCAHHAPRSRRAHPRTPHRARRRSPPLGARLHAAPPPWSGVGTWPVRAYAVVPRERDDRRTPELAVSGRRARQRARDRGR